MDIYLWVKSAHVVFVIALMAGLLIYPRYKIHQLSSRPGEPLFETMKDASNRLRRIILNPSLVLVWVLGLLMLYLDYARGGRMYLEGWMHAKLVLVLGLSGLHGYFIGLGKRVDAVTGTVQARTLRLLNEVPFLLMIGAVILVIVRPT
ncbi:MAG: CopD family protein [Hyphomonas sp.]|uniref:CopD family protein n=1 Tax=Hyphomonas sp. TaxID=87 RepID=UPI00181DD686|nr:CopD family protein [Hyphomonas sp.]MBA3070465.1 CopD family protein [Hyphomonas sp.]MBU4061995.1 CopD family protein [Alphaproteobacteria bacterium]MBU4164931.1 CopD family protein [Alphaproteobacteria bacterium]